MESLRTKHILVAGKKEPADLVIKHAQIVNVFTKEKNKPPFFSFFF
ncbi:hypothetical protein K2D_14300 [Enterococcus hirae]|nr:hypothetical protein K2D_14300 [Enterococcus hirae]